MKKSTFKKFVALALVVMMLASTCVINIVSAANLTITVNPVDSTFRSDSAEESVLTDGVKEGAYNGDCTVKTQGGDKWTDYALSFDASTTIDTIVVYGASPYGGGSWNLGDEPDRYVLKINDETINTEVLVDRSDESYVVITIKFVATTLTSAVLSIRQNKYVAAIYEIEAFNSADISEESSEEASSEEASSEEASSEEASSEEESSEEASSEETTDDPSDEPTVDPFDGKYFVIVTVVGEKVWVNENDQIATKVIDENAALLSEMVWKFEAQGDGTYRIVNKGTNRILDVVDGRDENGITVKTWENNDSVAQRFSVSGIMVQEGAYLVSIFPACSETRAIDVDAQTGKVQLWDYTADNNNQKFAMVEVTEEDTEDPTEVNYAAGKKYTIEGTLNYLTNEDDGKKLTDGVLADDAKLGQVEFEGGSAVNTITIDLRAKRTDISKVVFKGSRIMGNRQFADVTIEVSNNGKDFTAIAPETYTRTVLLVDSPLNDVVFDFANEVTARYVRLTCANTEYVFSVSEIEVIGYGAGGEVNPDDNDTPGDAGFAVVALVAIISLAGAVIVSKRKFN